MKSSFNTQNATTHNGGALALAFSLGLGGLILLSSLWRDDRAEVTTAENLESPNTRDPDETDFDADGWNQLGYDSEGFHKNGYNRQGFNREGFDFEGYKADKYNALGFDRAGRNQQFYVSYFWKLYNKKEEAFKQMQAGEYSYALLDGGRPKFCVNRKTQRK